MCLLERSIEVSENSMVLNGCDVMEPNWSGREVPGN